MKNLLQSVALLSLVLFFSCNTKKAENETTGYSKPAEGSVAAEPLAADTIAGETVKSREISEDSASINTITSEEPVEEDSVTTDTLESLDMDSDIFATVAPELSSKIKMEELPSTSDIGIKAYPNAFVVKLDTRTEYKGKMYITMELASADTPENVLNFYQKRRENWFYIENSQVHTFKKDKDKYFRETNTLQILPFNKNMNHDIDSLLSFDAQTLIRIYYEDMSIARQ